MRIYELAKRLGVKSKSIIYELSRLGIDGKTHSSNIEPNLVDTLEILFKGSTGQKESDKRERLQEFKRLFKDRWSEYQKYKIPLRVPEHVNLLNNKTNENGILNEEDPEKPILIKDEVLGPEFQSEASEVYDIKPEKQKDHGESKAVIAVLILSAIFIIGVMSITMINYYFWRDRTTIRPETKSLDLPVQKEDKAQLFTIQAGAFSDAFYAKSLMKTLNKKGYPAFITISYLKEKRLYKVFIGKFSERLEAEKLSVKIKKTEGIQTFVTLWERQYSEFTGTTLYPTLSAHPI
ncbi:MAG: translation initiation factor IF-2 N-terminal domain-containing protein [Thermodesulfovibrionales bacterium]